MSEFILDRRLRSPEMLYPDAITHPGFPLRWQVLLVYFFLALMAAVALLGLVRALEISAARIEACHAVEQATGTASPECIRGSAEQ